MKVILISVGGAVLLATIILFACAVAARIVFGFRWKAICGFERQAKRVRSLMYVSYGPLMPTAVFWLGSEDATEEKVAQGIAEGALPRQNYHDAVPIEVSNAAIHARIYDHKDVAVWPSAKAKQLYGHGDDIYPLKRLKGQVK